MLAGRVLSAYGGIRASFRAERARAPSEARLLFYAMLAAGLVLVARLPQLAAAVPAGAPPAAFLGANLVAHVFFGPLLLYGLAALSRLAAAAAGGRGDWRGARLALFWAVLLGAPLSLLAGAAGNLAAALGLPPGPVLSTAAGLATLWFWALCLAEAEGFARALPVGLALLAVPAAVAALLGAAGSLG